MSNTRELIEMTDKSREAFEANAPKVDALPIGMAGDEVPDAWQPTETTPNRQKLAAINAMTDFELTRSIIYECPALRLPQSFVERLGMVAQIVVLKGASTEFAQYLTDACNEKTARDAEPSAYTPACNEWMDIEAAPKDGTEILLCAKVTHDIGLCYWRDDAQFTGWTWGLGKAFNNPSYWMPLPKGPTQ